MSVKAKGSDSASDHNKVSPKGNESKAKTVSESGIIAVNSHGHCSMLLLTKFTGFIFDYKDQWTQNVTIYSDYIQVNIPLKLK